MRKAYTSSAIFEAVTQFGLYGFFGALTAVAKDLDNQGKGQALWKDHYSNIFQQLAKLDDYTDPKDSIDFKSLKAVANWSSQKGKDIDLMIMKSLQLGPSGSL